MYFEERDVELCIEGMGIVFYSPATTKNIPEGIDFFKTEYSKPEDVAAHIKKGDVVGFCTGSGIWGDSQTIYVYLNRLDEMPALNWQGVPQLCD